MTIGVLLLIAAALTLAAVYGGRRIRLSPRALESFRQIPFQVGRSLETGQPLQFALGSGGLLGGEAAFTLSAARSLERALGDVLTGEVPPWVAVADPVALLYARHLFQEAARLPAMPSPPLDRIEWAGASPMAYIAGLTLSMGLRPVAANILSGSFREEAILAGEAGQREGVVSLFAMPDPLGAAALWPLDPSTAVGEEALTAAPREDTPGRWLAHDLLRWLLIGLLIAAALGVMGRG